MTKPDDIQSNSDGHPANGVAELSYGDALAELEQLLTELEDADIDVDILTERVARGAQLVRHCQDRLAVVSGEVDKVVGDLEAGRVGDDSVEAGPNGTDEG